MPGWMRANEGMAPVVALTPDMEKQILENQVAALQAQLDAVRKRMDEVSQDSGKKS
jgi:hypothetical protein